MLIKDFQFEVEKKVQIITIKSYCDNNKLLLTFNSSMNAEELLKEATKVKNNSETPKTSKVKMEPETPKSSKVFF